MSVSNLMGIGLSSLMTSQAGMQVTGHNIANAHVDGFNRQRVETATAGAYAQGRFSFGQGVQTAAVRRVYDGFLAVEAGRAQASAAFEATRSAWMGRLESAFPLGEQGLSHAVQQFQGAWSDLASRPADRSLREVVLIRGQAVAERFNAAASHLGEVARSVRDELRQSVDQVNQLARQIAQANEQIAGASGQGLAANDLLDARDRLVNELRSLAGVTTLEGPHGMLSVLLPSGHALVQDRMVQSLQVQDGATPDAPVRLAISQGAGWAAIEGFAAGGGTVGGLLSFQDGELSATRLALVDLTSGLVEAFNDAHAQGFVSLALDDPGGELFAYDAATRAMSLAAGITVDGLATVGALNVGDGATLSGSALRLAGLGDQPAAAAFQDDHGQLLARVGMQVQQARSSSDLATALAEETRSARDGASGVNLDEEAARLMQYQQSYQAAAKILQAAQTVLDSLLGVAR